MTKLPTAEIDAEQAAVKPPVTDKPDDEVGQRALSRFITFSATKPAAFRSQSL